jgi:hypothetical protein
MPFFKSTYNILKKVDEDEVFESKWMDSNKLELPPKINWDYGRELKIEDVDIWEVLYEASEAIGLYAAWLPYAEFYLITNSFNYKNSATIIRNHHYWDKNFETYYGPGAQIQVIKRCKELEIPYRLNKIWVEDEDMWLYQKDIKTTKDIILPASYK